MKRVAITTCTCDNRYLDVLRVFLYTWRKHNGDDLPIRGDLYNGTPEIYDALRSIYPKLEVVHHGVPKADWENEANLLPIMYDRVHSIHEALLEPWDQILHIDCDIIVRASLARIWDGVEPNTIKILDRGKKREREGRARYQAGVHIFGNGPGTVRYYEKWIGRMGDRWAFHDGQKEMYFCVRDNPLDIRHVQLDWRYNDLEYHNESAVWHCRHTHLDRDEKYRTEFYRILAELNQKEQARTCSDKT